jgi:hypothetical protein
MSAIEAGGHGGLGTSSTAQNAVTAIDIVLEPDGTMIQRAQEANAGRPKNFPKGYSLSPLRSPRLRFLLWGIRLPIRQFPNSGNAPAPSQANAVSSRSRSETPGDSFRC